MNNKSSSTVLVVAMLWMALLTMQCGTTASEGETFASPDEAAKALVAAAKSEDPEPLIKLLGPASRELVVTSDPVADRNSRRRFSERAAEKMEVTAVPEQNDRKIIVVGSDDWPFPIPLVQENAKWHFDPNDGHDEILLRRIGSNELVALEVCRGFVEAQYDYFSLTGRAGGVAQYAQKFISTPGKRDGLYWKSDDPNDQSPVAEIIAKASAEGYTNKADPYHGYHFKVLTAQGPQAPGGAMSYIENGVLKRGFAMVSWPSDYGSTGVMTFFVNQTGIIYQKDLGEKTTAVASATTAYDPDKTWAPVPGSNIPN